MLLGVYDKYWFSTVRRVALVFTLNAFSCLSTKDELREEIKEKIKWKIDRSSPEDKLLDLVRYAKAAKKDIEHQVQLYISLLVL